MSRSRPLPLRKGAMLLAAMVITAAAVALPLAQGGIFERAMVVPRVQRVASIAPASHALLPSTGASSASPEAALTTRDERRSEARRVLDEPSSFRAAATPRSGSRNALAAELAALDAVRVKLRAGEAKTALGLLDAFGREFARPNLALEAEVLRIDALAQSGQREVAKRRAAVFVENHPKGVLTGRVRRYLEQ